MYIHISKEAKKIPQTDNKNFIVFVVSKLILVKYYHTGQNTHEWGTILLLWLELHASLCKIIWI